MRPTVTDGLMWFVHLSVTIDSSAKMAELIDMPFGIWTQVGPRNHVLGPVRPCEGAFVSICFGGRGGPL